VESDHKLILKVAILKCELCLYPLTPALLEVIMNNMKVEVHISTLLIFICRDLGLFMTLKPCVVLLVIPPRLLLQLPCSQILLICPLLVVEGKEENICVQSLPQGWIIYNRCLHLWIAGWSCSSVPLENNPDCRQKSL
jgi:hypothetical protein